MKNFKQIFSFMVFLLMPFTIMAQEDITDQYLQNADLSSLGGGWDFGDDGYGYTDWNTGADVPVVEFYHTWSTDPGANIGYARNFHFTQTITLPAGDYRIAVSAFYREGNGNGTNTKAYIFAGDKQQYVYGLSSHEQADVDGTTGKYVGGSDLLRAANAFSKGDFSNAFDFSLPTEQEITLGFRGYIDTYCSWCILGPVKLYKYSLENYLEDYRVKVAEANALTSKMGVAEAQALNDALVSENSFSLSSEVVQAIATLTNAINAAKYSIADYAALAEALENAATIIRNTEGVADSGLLDAYNNAISSIQNAYDAGTVADFAGSIAIVEEAVKPLVKYQKVDNSDYTLAIVNPHVNGSDGWTCERPYGGNGPMLKNDQFEYWAGNANFREDGSFDYYQEISGLPNGYYKVSASMYNSLNDEGGNYTVFSPSSGVYAVSGNQEVIALVEEDGTTLESYTTEEILVMNGKIRIGVKNAVTPMAARWFVADDFHLTLVRYVEGEVYGSCPDGNHPHKIDLGLPSGTKWACCNVGTTSPEGYGGYYAWGETEEKDSYNWENYIHCDGSSSTCHDIGTNITGTDYDVAHVKWGGSWQMPSWEQFDELLQNCNSEWTTVNGTYGRKFTSSNNGNSIFFPAAGANGGSRDVGSWDVYWTSSPRNENGAYGFGSSSGGVGMYNGFRLEGLSVRPVTTCEALEYQDGDIFTAQAVEGVEMTFKVISAASKTCQVGDGNNAAIDPSITSPLTIPSIVNGYSVTSIGAWALDVNSFTSITIPNSVTSIGWGALANSNNLTSITIPDGVTSIAGVFQCCENLTSVDIQNGLTSIGGLAFHSCYNLTTVNIPNSVTTIESVAFSYCTGLTSITIPNSVSNIESNAFWGCSGLTSVISEITEPSAINEEAFTLGDGEGWTTATLYVPAGTKALYEATEGWNKFQNIVEIEGDERELMASKDVDGVTYALFKEIVSRNDSRLNADGSSFYRGKLTLDITKDGTTNTFVIDDELYTDISDGMIPCMMFDMNANQMYVFAHSKTPEVNYGMDGYAYVSSMTDVGFQKETVFTSRNDGWWASFAGINDGRVQLLHFSCAGYFKMTSTRDIDGIWTTERGGYIHGNDYYPFWCEQDLMLVIPVDVQPLHNDEVVTFDEENGIDEETDLSGNVIGNIFYNINTGDGGYNAAEGCITVTKPVSDEQVAALEGQDIFGEDFKNQFTGIVFKVPAGSGTVKVTAETTGNTTLKVKIGSGAPIEMELDGKLKASFPYNVAAPTYVYIYAGQAGATVKGYGVPANGGGGELKIYGIQVNNDTPVGIADVQHKPSSTTIYNLSGQRLARPQRGLNIINGHKVAIK